MSLRPLSQSILDFLVPWPRLPWPLSWPDIFGRRAPMALEIGFGNGEFLADQARRRPDRDHVGLEIAWGSIQRLVRRLDREVLGNVRVLEGDAAFLIDRLFGPGVLAEVFINFSDPWPKARHHDRRLVRRGFLETLAGRLEPEGRVTIATDHAEYAEWIAEELESQDRLVSCFPTTRVHHLDGRTITRYESKGIAAGRRIHYFVWRRRPGDPTLSLHPEPNDTMPNVLMDGLSLDDAAAALARPRVFRATRQDLEILVKLLGTYRRADGDGILVDTLVKEGPLTQHFAIAVTPRPEGGLTLKLSAIGAPRPTWGVKHAVRQLAGILRKAVPAATVRSTTVGTVDPVPDEDPP